jgi:hypothetical protein
VKVEKSNLFNTYGVGGTLPLNLDPKPEEMSQSRVTTQ